MKVQALHLRWLGWHKAIERPLCAGSMLSFGFGENLNESIASGAPDEDNRDSVWTMLKPTGYAPQATGRNGRWKLSQSPGLGG